MDFTGKTILIVDDDRIIAMAEAAFLSKNGYKVLTAGNGEEVFGVFESGSDCHMVLLDIDLGNGISGPELAERILEIRDIPIVFVTSHTDGDMTEKVKHIKKYGYVVKNSGDFVVLSAIEMAFELFYEKKRTVEAGIMFEQIANTSPALIWMSGCDKNFTWFNNRWLAFTGRQIEEGLSNGLIESIHHEDKDNYIKEYIKAFDSREPFTMEYRLRRFDGVYRWIIDSGHPRYTSDDIFDGYIGSCVDITGRKLIEYKNMEQMSFVSTLLDTISLPVFYKDREGRYIGCNSAFENFMHTKFDEIKGKTVFDLSPREIAQKYYEMDEALFVNPGTQSYEWVVKSLSGELRFVIFNKATFNDHAGEVAGLIGIILDITDQKAYEEKITNLLCEKDLLLKEKETLLKEVHHRIKNNMSTIASLLMIQADTMIEPSAIAALNDARSRVMSMMLIYDKLYRSADFRNIQVRDYLVNLINEIFSTFPGRKNLNIEYVVDEFVLDSKALFPLGIIVNELLTNSMKHAFPGGREGKIKVSVTIDKDNLIEASISDDGIGIPEKVDFKSVQSFGLNLIDLLTRQIKGSIEVNRNSGTEFVIKFRKS